MKFLCYFILVFFCAPANAARSVWVSINSISTSHYAWNAGIFCRVVSLSGAGIIQTVNVIPYNDGDTTDNSLGPSSPTAMAMLSKTLSSRQSWYFSWGFVTSNYGSQLPTSLQIQVNEPQGALSGACDFWLNSTGFTLSQGGTVLPALRIPINNGKPF